MNHCCEMMESNVAAVDTPITYVPKFREYGIDVLDGGSGFIEIEFCPWCGVRLPGSLRTSWFDILEAKGLEVDDVGIPQKMLSDAWWKHPKAEAATDILAACG